jgi:hypothetical protein
MLRIGAVIVNEKRIFIRPKEVIFRQDFVNPIKIFQLNYTVG